MKKFTIIYFFLISSFAYCQQFIDINPFPNHQNGLIVTPQFADINGDGWLDVFANRIIYINNKNGKFVEYFVQPLAMTPYFNGYMNTSLGDYNNDGLLDVLATYKLNDNNNFSKILKNTGKDSSGFWIFEDIGANLKGVYNLGMAKSIRWGDIDDDGDLDILILGNSKGTTEVTPFTEIYRNDNGTFNSINSGMMGFKNGSAEFIDYDGDGDLDVIVTGNVTESPATSPYTRVYNNTNGKFTETKIDLLNVEESTVTWGDYDMDGKPDVFISGRVLQPFSALYHNDGNGIFTKTSDNFESRYWGDASWGDFDNDGDLDLFVSGEPFMYPTRYYKNNNGTFILQDSIKGGRIAVSSPGDFDNDGDLDLLYSSFMNDKNVAIFTIYQNDIINKNSPPSIPSNLKSVVNGNNVSLSWNPSSDNLTKSQGLTYNIYVGNSMNKISVVTPLSLLTTGKRFLSEFGNCQLNLTRLIKGLPDGIYFWSVQSIDNTYEASGFAPEQTFTIGNPPKIDSLIIIQPNGGEIYNANESISIKWDGILAKDTVLVEFSPDNGATWQIISNKGINRSVNWATPDIQSTKCLAKVSSMKKMAPTVIQRFNGLAAKITKVRYSNDGLKLLSHSLDSNFRLWDIKTGNVISKFKNFRSPSNAWTGFYQSYADFSLDNSRILTVEQYTPNSFITVWNSDASQKIFEIVATNNQFLNFAAISPDNNLLAVANGTNLLIYDLKSPSVHDPIKTIQFNQLNYANDLAFSYDGKYLGITAYDSSLIIYNTNDWSLYYRAYFNERVGSLDFNHLNSKVLLTDYIGNIIVWDILNHTTDYKVKLDNFLQDATFSNDDSMILFVKGTSTAGIFEPKSNRVLCDLFDGNIIIDGRFSPNMKYAVTTDSVIKIWELNPIQSFSDISNSNWTILKDNKTPYLEISIDDVVGKINEIISVPIRLKKAINLNGSGITNIKTNIIFNGNILYPVNNTPGGSLNGEFRNISITLPISPIETDILAKLDFEILLGDSDQVQISFDKTEAIGNSCIFLTDPGIVKISDICKDGGTRYVNSTKGFSIFPNPAINEFNIKLPDIEFSNLEFAIYDLFGNKVETDLNNSNKNNRNLQCNTSKFASGYYYIITKLDAKRYINKILIMK
jgi:hypothetical protein